MGSLPLETAEYYGHNIRDTDLLAGVAPANVQVLNDDTCEIENVRFLGTTLWTDFRLYGEGESWFSRETARRQIDDFTSIRSGGRLFTPEDSVALHEASKAWLVSELEKDFNGPTCGFTGIHMLPATTRFTVPGSCAIHAGIRLSLRQEDSHLNWSWSRESSRDLLMFSNTLQLKRI